METFYSILGVSESADETEIKKAYKQKAIQYHPDKVNNLGEKIKLVAEMEFKKINEAKDVLLNEDKRNNYDQTLRKSEDRPPAEPDTWPVDISTAEETPKANEFQQEINGLQNMIVSLNYEISLLKKDLTTEKKSRGFLEDKIVQVLEEKRMMAESFRSIEELYRNEFTQIIDDLFMDIEMTEDEYRSINSRIAKIQHDSYQIISQMNRYDDKYDHIKNKMFDFDDITKTAEVKQGANSTDAINAETRIDWDAEEMKESQFKDETPVEQENCDVDSELKSLEELGKVETARDYDSLLHFGGQQSPQSAGGYLRNCPFCGREVNSEQSYCYYCGAVF